MKRIFCKKEYTLFTQKIEDLLQKYYPKKDDKNIYYINTPYGELRISISDYYCYCQWIFTKIEYPEKVPLIIEEKYHINKFSGKCYHLGNRFPYLLAWLHCYIEDLVNPQENGKLREPISEMLHDKEGKFALWK